MKQLMTKFMNDESGQDLIEYALIAALIALVAISALTSVGSKVSGVLSSIASSL
jgi:pilus assembly protein Flp/PilA